MKRAGRCRISGRKVALVRKIAFPFISHYLPGCLGNGHKTLLFRIKYAAVCRFLFFSWHTDGKKVWLRLHIFINITKVWKEVVSKNKNREELKRGKDWLNLICSLAQKREAQSTDPFESRNLKQQLSEKITTGKNGLSTPSIYSDVGFWFFNVGSFRFRLVEYTKGRIVHPPAGNVSCSRTIVRKTSFILPFSRCCDSNSKQCVEKTWFKSLVHETARHCYAARLLLDRSERRSESGMRLVLLQNNTIRFRFAAT